jgi:hypothetical protein
MANLHYRTATIDDAMSVFKILEEVAPEIPIKFKSDNHKAKILELVQQRCGLGKSLVAIDAPDHIVAFLLVQPQARGACLVPFGDDVKNLSQI